MDIVLKPITQAATKRAQSADPNGLRCLIENCPGNQAVQLTHLFERDAAADERQTGSLEWAWNMQQNTLNLDTRRNVFFLGASMNQLYREKKWALVPEEAILDRYLYEECLFPLPRDDFPELKDETFRYTFLPIQDMEDVYLTRSTALPSGERTINVYCYPFERLPQITSHVHPCFAILQVGSILENKLDLTTSRALIAKHPILEKITAIYNEWVALLPQNAKDNPTFMPPPTYRR
ncbi:hypothetical protein BJ165DRAFT_1614511 [Panaeolus papilionaceus]|nr:hypothetical protein BJ165DRAFT_1614511 [Panaeolus papilionaceus]